MGHEGWKDISDENIITKGLLMRNRMHLSMSRYLPFSRAPLTEEIGLDVEGTGMEEMLQGTFRTDKEGSNGGAAYSEMIFLFRHYTYQSLPPPEHKYLP